METSGIQAWRGTAVATGVAAAVAALLVVLEGWRGCAMGGAGAEGVAGTGREGTAWTEMAWRTLRGSEGAKREEPKGTLAGRYRLAGVFMVSVPDVGDGAQGSRGAEEVRYALLEDAKGGGGQVVAAEGEWFGGDEASGGGAVRVVRVEQEFVRLSDGEREEMLFLARAAGSGRGGGTGGGTDGGVAERTVLEKNRFGERTGEARWEFKRAELMKYAQEVLDDPQRVAGMYEGMAPDWDAEHKVAGYRLDTSKGEADFYAQVGLKDGDVVRRVNSIKMTSQRRSEFLLGEFLQGRLGTIVIDIERDGKAQKLVYLID